MAEDERTRILIEPSATFIDTSIADAAPTPEDRDEARQDSASLIPPVFPALRNLP